MSEWTTESAEWYAENYGEYATNRLAIDRVQPLSGCAILDIGCGTGAALRHAAARGADGPLVGIDPVPRMVEIAEERRQGAPLQFKVGQAEALPVDDGSFDVVLAFDSYDHWTDPARGLEEVRRVLRPGGRLVVVKDGGVPALRSFVEQVTTAGFRVDREDLVQDGDVCFTLWQCRVEADPTNGGTTDA
jgi:ubiquinone/menaquinone biosynthesis C-methylase UbiE